MEDSSALIVSLLRALNCGDTTAANDLLPLVYAELHRLAAAYMRRERADHTLQPTALVNEAYLEIAKRSDVQWQDRSHFIAYAAQVMRRVLVDHARARKAAVRGGGQVHVTFDEVAGSAPSVSDVLVLDEALARLETLNPRQAKVVELRCFGGLSVDEAAAILGIAPRSIKRDWALARMWLADALRKA